jgi:hypothetical protein
MHNFGYRSWETDFTPNASIILLWTQNDFCECFGTFVKCEKMQNLCFGRECTISGYWNWENHFPPNTFILIPRTNNHVCECLGHFGILWNVNWHETCVSSLNALFRGTEVVKMISQQIHPFNSIRPKIMFGSGLEHFLNLPHVKRCKTCVSVLNAAYRGTEVVKMVSDQMHPFYSIAQKIMVWIVFE